MVDNWLYMFGIVHVYQKRLPVDDAATATFYLPTGDVYIECWDEAITPGMLQAALDRYHRNSLRVIGLSNEDIYHLDEVLPAQLLQYGIKTA